VMHKKGGDLDVQAITATAFVVFVSFNNIFSRLRNFDFYHFQKRSPSPPQIVKAPLQVIVRDPPVNFAFRIHPQDSQNHSTTPHIIFVVAVTAKTIRPREDLCLTNSNVRTDDLSIFGVCFLKMSVECLLRARLRVTFRTEKPLLLRWARAVSCVTLVLRSPLSLLRHLKSSSFRRDCEIG